MRDFIIFGRYFFQKLFFVRGVLLALLLMLLAFALIFFAEAQALIGPGAATQKPLTSVSGTIHAGLGLTLVLLSALRRRGRRRR